MSRFSPIVFPVTKDFVLRNGYQVPSKPAEYRFNCIYCGDKIGKFYANIENGYYKCMRGCVKGRIGVSNVGSNTLQTITLEEKLEKKKPKIINFSLNSNDIGAQVVKSYLYNRNIQDHIITAFKLHGSILFNTYAVAFPVMTPLMTTHYTGYRLIDHPAIRYYTEFPKLLYGLPTILTSKIVYIKEGPSDVWCSLPLNSVCTFGKNLSEEQLSLLRNCTANEFLVCLDGSVDRGKKMQFALKIRMETGKKVGYIQLPQGVDPGEIGDKIVDYPIVRL